MEPKWKVKQSRTTRFRFFDVVEEEVETGSGTEMKYEYVTGRQGVCVMPLLDGGRRVVCLRQYRHAIRSWQWEFPAGGLEEGVDALVMARRELSEETGYTAERWTDLGAFYPSFGFTTQSIHLFAAEELTAGEQHLEPGEELEVHILETEELVRLIANGEFRHGAGLAAVARWWARGRS
ncbi:NUDIX domain-containing protein [Paenibacillus alkalitolerans]|uniref:NUDIX domain-containing protein n=1 Tax=Paenibacillus alkalitolerans TaxID=2799335 RepID=UPI0018F78AD0|nr:NUDIX hydrolase [Paenibacillus alkalitolerans]